MRRSEVWTYRTLSDRSSGSLSKRKIVLISPEELRIPDYIREDVLKASGHEFEEVTRLEDALPKLDVLYMTRVQKERFFNEDDYVRMKDFYILDKEKMKLAGPDMLVLHPLPRVNEISTEVDSDPRAAYFKQVQYGVYVRMALILTLHGGKSMLNVWHVSKMDLSVTSKPANP